jgi:hypothetical protein
MEVVENTELDDNFSGLRVSSNGSSNRFEALNSITEANDTDLGASQDASVLLSVIDGFDSDEVESSQAPVMEKRNAAANEHEQGEKHDLLSVTVPQPETIPIQQIGDSQNWQGFKASSVFGVNFSVVSDGIVAADSTPSVRSANLSLAEANLSALSEVIDGCFRNGLELDVVGAQLLSMLTYLQGLPLKTDEPLQSSSIYQEMEYISALARTCIEEQTSSGAVFIYTQMIVLSSRLLKESMYPDFMPAMKNGSPFSPIVKNKEYLDHEATLLQIVIAGYFKLQLSNETPLLPTSLKMMGVIRRLRDIHSMQTYYWEPLDHKLQSLTQTLRYYSSADLSLFPHQFRNELLFHSLDIATCYSSLYHDFEVAEMFFQFRHHPLSNWKMMGSHVGLLMSENRRWEVSKAIERYKMHQSRRDVGPNKPRVRPWDIRPTNSTPYVTASTLLLSDELVRLPMERLYKSLIRHCKDFQLSKLKLREAHLVQEARRLAQEAHLAQEARLVQIFPIRESNFDTETEGGFTSSSARSYKYGVTLSESDFPGIDLSKYTVQ